jgi:hypothetical protein
MSVMKALHLLPMMAALSVIPCVAQNTNTPPPPGWRGPENLQHRIERREANLEKRIDRGRANGKLTAGQDATLEGRLDQLKRDEAKAFHNDGKIAPQEGRELNREANKLSREIHQAKHPGRH